MADGVKRHARSSRDGTWDKVLAAIIDFADAAGDVDWAVSVDSTVNRGHQQTAASRNPHGGIGEPRPGQVERRRLPLWLSSNPS